MALSQEVRVAEAIEPGRAANGWPSPTVVRMVLSVLLDCAGSGLAWPSKSFIAEASECDPRTVQRAISALEGIGAIVRVRRGGKMPDQLFGQSSVFRLEFEALDALAGFESRPVRKAARAPNPEAIRLPPRGNPSPPPEAIRLPNSLVKPPTEPPKPHRITLAEAVRAMAEAGEPLPDLKAIREAVR